MKCLRGFFCEKKSKEGAESFSPPSSFCRLFWAGDFAGFLHHFASCFSCCPCHKKDKSDQEQQAVAQMQGLSGIGLTMATTLSCCQCLFRLRQVCLAQFQGCRRGCTLLQGLPSRHTYAPSGPLPPSPACNMSKNREIPGARAFPLQKRLLREGWRWAMPLVKPSLLILSQERRQGQSANPFWHPRQIEGEFVFRLGLAREKKARLPVKA